jgi:hypothetical protein
VIRPLVADELESVSPGQPRGPGMLLDLRQHRPAHSRSPRPRAPPCGALARSGHDVGRPGECYVRRPVGIEGREAGSAVTSRSYQVPRFPPRSLGSAGPTGAEPAFINTRRDAALSSEAAALSSVTPCWDAASRHRSRTVAVATPCPARSKQRSRRDSWSRNPGFPERGPPADAATRAPPDPIEAPVPRRRLGGAVG